VNDIAVGAIKFSILKSAPGKDMIFDFEKSLSFEGDSGPYLQYTHARLSALLDKAHAAAIDMESYAVESPERALEQAIIGYTQVIEKAQVAIDKLLKRAKTRGALPATDDELGRYIFAGLRDKLMHYIPTQGSYLWERGHANTIQINIGQQSVLNGKTPAYIVAGSNSPIGTNRARQQSVWLSNCQVVKPEWLGALPIAA
jgi:hypothetical protein